MQINLNGWRRLVRLDTLLLLVALVAGVAGALLSARYLGARAAATDASLRSRYEAKSVVVAAEDLPAGESLDASRLAVRRMPKEFLPGDAVAAEHAAQLIGSRTAIAIRRGTPVVAAALRETGAVQRLSAVLDGARRALTIAVDQVNSQAGNLQPGDRVDLYYSRSTDGDAILVPLLQHTEILATGDALLDDLTNPDVAGLDRNFSTVTLGVSAEDAVRVLLAQQSGTVSVVLRSPTDASQMPAVPRNSRELLQRPAGARAASGDSRIEVLVGGSGGLLPERSWLTVGQRSQVAAGDAS